ALRVTRQEKTAGATLVVLQQYVSTVPVLNGSIDVVVTDSGVIASVNNHAVQLGATADSASDATQAAAKAASQWQATLSGVTDKRGF
ncbi:hypothetical protein AAEI00_21490, partial [Shewanella algae]|uniref:hypothetical protein n=1 Tax=Shewanella algae TaxID=38313 RepID=UPI0031957857